MSDPVVIPDKYRLVPIDPTDEQLDVGKRCIPHFDNIRRRYTAMVDAAPKDVKVVERHVVVNDTIKTLFSAYVVSVGKLYATVADPVDKVVEHLKDIPIIVSYVESLAHSRTIEAEVKQILDGARAHVKDPS